MNEKRIIEVSGRKWECAKEDLPEHTLWHSDWHCPDGDGATLYIDKSKQGFSLHCFSGIPASSIYIDNVDFGRFWDKAGLSKFTNVLNFELQCIYIADYLCGIFCEWTD